MTTSFDGNLRPLLFGHFEKVALGALVAFFFAAGVRPLVARPAELDLRGDVTALDRDLGTHLTTFEAQVPPVDDALSRLQASTNAPPPIDRFGPWLAHRRPSPACFVAKPLPLPKSDHKPPVLAAKEDHGLVTLTWGPGEPSEANITHYRLSRCDARGAVVILAESETGGRLEDAKVSARETYTYTIEETAEAPPAHEPLPAAEVKLAAERTVTLPRDIIIVVDRDPVLDPFGQPVSIKLTVHRWTKGTWARHEIQAVQVGAAIGDGAFATGAELVQIVPLVGEARVGVRWPTGLVETLSSRDKNPELKR
jgi:hypothetical protein